MGAAYVLTGSINQACVESGSSDVGARDAGAGRAGRRDHGPRRRHVRDGRQGAGAQARHHVRHARRQAVRTLSHLRRSLEELPAAERALPGKEPLPRRWKRSGRRRAISSWQRDPAQVARADSDPKHKMALVFRWYLGLSSRWANAGEPSRKVDYQVWCGPAMGAFNEWTKGSFLEQPRNRRVVTVALQPPVRGGRADAAAHIAFSRRAAQSGA